MDVEKTIQSLLENAAAHDARIEALERTSAVIQEAVLRLTEHQIRLSEHEEHLDKSLDRLEATVYETQESVRELRQSLRALDDRTDQRIAALVTAVAKLAEREANGPGRQ